MLLLVYNISSSPLLLPGGQTLLCVLTAPLLQHKPLTLLHFCPVIFTEGAEANSVHMQEIPGSAGVFILDRLGSDE